MTGREFARRTGWAWRTIVGWVLHGQMLGRWAWTRMDVEIDAEMARIMLDFKARYESQRTGAQVTVDRLGMILDERKREP